MNTKNVKFKIRHLLTIIFWERKFYLNLKPKNHKPAL